MKYTLKEISWFRVTELGTYFTYFTVEYILSIQDRVDDTIEDI